MSKKIDRATHGPSWTEVILGAVLSLLLGAVLGAVLLIARPVVQVQDLPKPEDRVRGAVYYVPGASGGNARQAQAKRKEFTDGKSITATESELNALLNAMAAPAAPAAGGAAPATPPPADSGTLAPGAPNVRIREGVMQVGVPVTVNALGLSHRVIAQARGHFEKDGDVFVYHAEEVYLGSCPIQRIPFLAGMVQDKVLGGQSIPEDVVAAWRKLSNVEIEGNVLKLTAP